MKYSVTLSLMIVAVVLAIAALVLLSTAAPDAQHRHSSTASPEPPSIDGSIAYPAHPIAQLPTSERGDAAADMALPAPGSEDRDEAASALLEAPVTIEVTDIATGRVVPGADVRIVARDFVSPNTVMSIYAEKTDMKGRCVVTSKVGLLEIAAYTDHGQFGSTEVLHVGDATAPTIMVTVESLAIVRGVVLDAVTMAPIANATVRNFALNSLGRLDVASNEVGWFEFPYWVYETAATLTISAPGYGAECLTLLVDRMKGWAVLGAKPGAAFQAGDAFVEILLAPEKHIAGRVLRPDGSAVKDARVRAIGYVMSSYAIRVRNTDECRSDDAGAFELRSLRSDIPHVVVCESANEGLALAVSGADEHFSNVGTLRLSPFANVRGSIFGTHSVPLCGAQVEVTTTDYSSSVSGGRDDLARSVLSALSVIGHVDHRGNFSISGVPGTRVLITVRLGSSNVIRRQVDIVPGEPNDLGRIDVSGEFDLREGLVLTDDGQPVIESRLSVMSTTGKGLVTVETDGRGSFRFVSFPDVERTLLFALTDANGRTIYRWRNDIGEYPVLLRMAE